MSGDRTSCTRAEDADADVEEEEGKKHLNIPTRNGMNGFTTNGMKSGIMKRVMMDPTGKRTGLNLPRHLIAMPIWIANKPWEL